MIAPTFIERQSQFASRRTTANNGKPVWQPGGEKIVKGLLELGNWFNWNHMISRAFNGGKVWLTTNID